MGPVVWVVACRPGDEAPVPGRAPQVVGEVTLSTTIEAPLSRRLVLATDVPTTLTLTLTSEIGVFDVTFPGTRSAWDVPVLGLPPGAETVVEVHLADALGREAEIDPLSIVTVPMAPSFPSIEALAHDIDRAEPGWWLASIELDGGGWLVAIDPVSLTFGWAYFGYDFGDARRLSGGTFVGLAREAVEIDVYGETRTRWGIPETPADEMVLVPFRPLHHELFPLTDQTFVSFTGGSFTSPSYPVSYDDPTPAGSAKVADDRVVSFDRDGTVEFDWSLAERLDPSRIGYDSLNLLGQGYDWTHANAVIPRGDGFLVSVRHQDAMVMLDRDGEVQWILGDPAGWSAPFADLLLSPVGPLTWQYHQHGPSIAEDGTIVVFDNHNWGATPYTPLPTEPVHSRVVAFRVDDAARTVEQVWEWAPAVPMWVDAMGNAQVLPETGHVFADFASVGAEGDLTNEAAGRGNRSIRLIEFDPAMIEGGSAPAPIVDLRLSTDRSTAEFGVTAYRATVIPSLYPPDVTVVRR
ncbi:MAG: aryl-sulfate sulfotransferase [Myxococcota bacterium]